MNSDSREYHEPDPIADVISILHMMMRSRGEEFYTEQYRVKADGKINFLERTDGRSPFLHFDRAELTKEDLYTFFQQVEERDSSLHFSFREDVEGQWFEYTVKSNNGG